MRNRTIACSESFFATAKKECIYLKNYAKVVVGSSETEKGRTCGEAGIDREWRPGYNQTRAENACPNAVLKDLTERAPAD